MCKILIFASLVFGITLTSFAQLASWDLLTNGIPTQVDVNVAAGNFTGGSGINSIIYGTTGAYTTGWSTTTIDLNDYYQINISPATGYQLTIQELNFGERRSLTGIHTYEVQYAYDSTFISPITIATVNVPDDDLERTGNITGLNIVANSGDTIYFRWYGYGAEGSTGNWRINDATLNIIGIVSQANINDINSIVQNPSSQIVAGNISSLATNSTIAVPVFKTTVIDAGSGDGLPTKITSLTIKNNNPTNGANWQTAIQGITVLNGTNPVTIQQYIITNNTISLTFLPIDLIVPDGSSTDLTFSIFLNNSNLIDGSQFQFYISALNHNCVSDNSGSGFQTNFISDIVSNIFTIDVTATKLQFVTVPQSVWANQNFNVSIKATDINNNIDLNTTNQITIQKDIGNGILNSTIGLSVPLTNGVYNWTDLTYDTPEYFSLNVTDNNSVLTSATSNLINCLAAGQILNESFTDGDFNNNPSWFGETGDFIISPQYQLQLFTSTSNSYDTSTLVTPISLQLDSIEWQAYINLNFAPSDNNFIKYYLISNNLNLKDSLHGYFIKIGENLSADAIELFYQSGNTITSICRGVDGFVATNPHVRIKVIRTNTGAWRIYADPTGGSSFELQATATDNSFFSSGFYTGVFCRYTSTYASNKFSFDDFYCGPIQIDTIPPAFASLSVIDSLHIDLNFSEGISLSTAQNITNYNVNNSVGNPSSIVRDAMDYKKIHLAFSTPFVTGTIYTITASNLKDFSDNIILNPINEQFIWYKALPFDVQINEIMANPTPLVGLPDAEYIELHNRTNYDIDLTNWTLTIGTSTDVFPPSKILANDYLILCTTTNQALLQTYGTTIGIISSSTALVDAGKLIILQNKEGQVISNIEYSDSWYRNNNKKNGGWSLEQIDPLNPCGEYANWTASTDIKGGTPGKTNSTNHSNLDNANPELLRATLTLPDTLLLTFSETLFENDTINTNNFSVNHNIGSPITAIFTDITKKKIKLTFNQTFVKDTIYEITVIGQLKDCAGNLITNSNNAIFAIPDTIIPGSFVINEVLFNPYTGSSDYIELYNNTSKIYDLKDARLSVLSDTSLYDITTEGFYLFPGEYAVLSTDPNKIYPFYSCPNKKTFITLSTMPSYNNSDGEVTIINKSFQIIDDFSYTESMQFKLLNSFQGVSLERIHPDQITQDAKNWHSAAESAGFGTPGYKNSQYAQFEIFDGEITIEPEVFSPDNDGYNDILNIHYKFGEPGYVGNVTIFDARGRKIRSLVSNEMLAVEGYFTWDGLNDYNQKASIGIYVVFVEVFNLNGKVKHFKKTCVVGTKL